MQMSDEELARFLVQINRRELNDGFLAYRKAVLTTLICVGYSDKWVDSVVLPAFNKKYRYQMQAAMRGQG